MLCLFCSNECGDKKYCNEKCCQGYHNSLKVGTGECSCGKRIYEGSKYCKVCMPKYLKRKDRSIEYTCERCEKIYKLAENKNGATTKYCSSCQVNHRKDKRKQEAIDYKGGKCIICGYNRCNRALTFHHLNPLEKDFGISGNHARKWEILLIELDKCVLLCSNCHAEVHDGLIEIDAAAQNRTV